MCWARETCHTIFTIQEHFVIAIDTHSIKTKQEISIYTADGDDAISIEGVFSRRVIIGNLIKVDNLLPDDSFQVEIRLPENIDVESSISVEVEAGVTTVTVKIERGQEEKVA